VKLPTGSHKAADRYFLADGTAIQYPVDQSIQPSDGGWGVILQSQVYRRLLAHGIAYAGGSYLLSLRKMSDVAKGPGDSVYWSVPDTYTARAGVASLLWPRMHISASLGGRVDGQPVRNLIGGGNLGFRRPGYTWSVDPGIAITGVSTEILVSAPIRVAANREPSLLDLTTGKGGGGDFAARVLFVSYARRF
jgi:hypothetical protein